MKVRQSDAEYSFLLECHDSVFERPIQIVNREIDITPKSSEGYSPFIFDSETRFWHQKERDGANMPSLYCLSNN